MCLTINQPATNRAIKTRRTTRRTRNFYKVVIRNVNWGMLSRPNAVTLIAPYQDTKYRAGVNKSSRKSRTITPKEREYGNINAGIHVYTSKSSAKRSYTACKSGARIVPVKCHMRHFVAFGSGGEAVFTQITIPRKTFAALTK